MTGGGLRSGARLHITRARLCWCPCPSAWMTGTYLNQRHMKGTNVGGQLEGESNCRVDLVVFEALLGLVQGRGMEGGSVVQRRLSCEVKT